MHPRVICDGFEIAKKATLKFLDSFKATVDTAAGPDKVEVADKEVLRMLARTTLRTKVH